MAYTAPCVCAQWRSLLERRRRTKRFHDNRPYKRHHFLPKMYAHYCTMPDNCVIFYMSRLIDAGHWALLDWMIAVHRPLRGKPDTDYLQSYVCVQLAAHGDLARLRIMTDTHEFCLDMDAYFNAARCGHLEVIKWAYAASPCSGIVFDSIRSWAAYGGHIDIIQWTLNAKLLRDSDICRYAARAGRLSVIEWLRERGCSFDHEAALDAARKGHLDVLKWVAANGYAFSSSSSSSSSSIMNEAVAGGHVEILEWLIARGCRWTANTCAKAIRHGHWHIVEWLSNRGCPLDEEAFTAAAASVGDIRILSWLSKRECPQSADAPRRAARAHRWAVLVWLIDKAGHVCDESVTDAVERGGDLATIQFLCARGFTLSAKATLRVINSGRLDALCWLRDRGHPLHPDISFWPP